MAIGVAFRAFFAALGGGEKAQRIEAALSDQPAQDALPAPKEKEKKTAEPKPKKPARSDAVTLLAALQREARLVDIVKEPLDGYSDSQVGAAARDVLRDTAAVLDRMFALAQMCIRDRHYCEQLAEAIPRHQFKIPIQGVIGGTVIARSTIAPYRKDVTEKLYGGDVTRKNKLLDKQKKGKARMKQFGSVNIPQKAFVSVLRAESK